MKILKYSNSKPSNKVHIINPITGKTYCKFENSGYFLNRTASEKPNDRKYCNICRRLEKRITGTNRTIEKKKTKNEKSKNRQDKKIAREYLIHHFRLHKYASNIAICLCIHNENKIEMPATDADAICIIVDYWKKIKRQNACAKPDYKKMPADEFYGSKKWRELRFVALRMAKGRCSLCGAKASDGVQLHVDHIKPRSKYPQFQFDLDNLQILCEDCNIGKSNFDETDFRNIF